MKLPEHPVVLVTGATDGIGRETALELARRGARVVVHGRSEERLQATIEALRSIESANASEPLEPLLIDLSRLDEVRTAGQTLSKRGIRVDVIVNNAGVYQRKRALSADGFEMTLAVNHLAPFVLTHALLASEAGASLKRIVNVSSIAQGRGQVVLDDLNFDKRGFDPYATYAASKLANVLFSVELARRLRPRGITVNALHPGVVSTKLLTEGFGVRGSDSLAKGAATSVKLALDPSVEEVTGQYFVDGHVARASTQAANESLVRSFYELSAKLTGTQELPG
ncbi:MAG: SDR family oxidoreductase [Polyangiaceae bacterium]